MSLLFEYLLGMELCCFESYKNEQYFFLDYSFLKYFYMLCDQGSTKQSRLVENGEFLIAISTLRHKIVKFINKNSEIKALKIFILPKDQGFSFMVKNHLQNIRAYLLRIYELNSSLALPNIIDIEEEQTDNICIQVVTQFCEYPNLYDYYRTEIITMSASKRKANPEKNRKELIHYFQELFQLMVKGGGIQNYFYTANNISIVPPDPLNFRQTRLILNLTSTAGLKFLFQGNILPKEEFIQIFPCLPPNIYELLSAHEYDQINILIKIRSFAFLMLVHIIKRVPFFFEDNFKSMIDPQDSYIKEYVTGSPQMFKTLLKIESKAIKEARQMTKIDLKSFFKKVLVENSIDAWSEVHEMVFLKNYYCLPLKEESKSSEKHEQGSKSPEKQERSEFQEMLSECRIKQQQYFQNMLELIWRAEPNQEYYRRLGFVKGNKHVYLLVKLNCNFHRVLKYPHILAYFNEERFSEDSNSIALKLMNIFSLDYFFKDDDPKQKEQPANLQSGHCEIGKVVKETLTRQEKNEFNPFYFRGGENSYSCHFFGYLRGPASFLKNVLTYDNKLKTEGEETGVATSSSYKLDTLMQLEKTLWLV